MSKNSPPGLGGLILSYVLLKLQKFGKTPKFKDDNRQLCYRRNVKFSDLSINQEQKLNGIKYLCKRQCLSAVTLCKMLL